MLEREAVNLMTIVANALNLFATEEGPSKYSKIDNHIMALSRSVPRDMVVNIHPGAVEPDESVKFQSAWGGSVSITPTASADKFSVNYDAVPPAICLELVARTIHHLREIKINGNALPYDSTTNRKTVSVACKSDPSGVARMNFISG